MFNYRVFSKAEFKRRLLAVMVTNAHAEGEEKDLGGAEGATKPTLNFEDLIANARREEKDKLYPRIKELEKQIELLTRGHNDDLIKIATAQEELKTLKANSDTAKDTEIQKLTKEIADLKAEIEKVKSETPKEEDIRANLEKEYNVKLYIKDKVAEAKDEILPKFMEGITGTTNDEVDTAIAKAKADTLEIKKQLGIVDEEGKPITSKKKQNVPPVVNPTDNISNKTIDSNYVQSLDPRSKEYLELRKSLGLR